MGTDKNNNQNTKTSVYNALKNSILTLNLIPGTSISENEISQRYEVSRTPVREAFIQLAKESLIQVKPQKETRVSLIDIAKLRQERFIRKSLETSVLEPFIKHADSITYINLQQCIEVQKEMLQKKDYIQFLKYDNFFHKIIFEGAGQDLSWETIENTSGHYYRVRLLTIWINGIASDIINQHGEILEALKNKDIEEARKISEMHLYKLDNEKETLLKQFPNYFAQEEKDKFNVNFGGLQLD